MELLAESKTYLSFVDINPSTIVFTLINTLIIFLLYRFFLHNKVMAILDKRQQMINADFDAADAAKKEAEQTKAEYTEKLLKYHDKEAEIIAEANADAARMKQQAQESIEQEKRRALNEVKDQISEVVVLAASKVCEKEISEKDNAGLIEGFLAGVGKEG